LVFQESAQAVSVVGADSERASLQTKDNAVVSPDILDPAAPRIPMNAPTIQERGSSLLDFKQIVITNPLSKQRKGAKMDGKLVALILRFRQ